MYWVYFIRYKSDALIAFISSKQWLDTKMGTKFKFFTLIREEKGIAEI